MQRRAWLIVVLVVVLLFLLAPVVVVKGGFEKCSWNMPARKGHYSTRAECEEGLRRMSYAPRGECSVFQGLSCNCLSDDALRLWLAVALSFAAAVVAPSLFRSALRRRHLWAKIVLIAMLLLAMLLLGVFVLLALLMFDTEIIHS